MKNRWAGIEIAAVLALGVTIVGAWSGEYAIALGVLVLVGALFPPAAIMLGGVALLWFLYRHGAQAFAAVANLTNQGGTKKRG